MKKEINTLVKSVVIRVLPDRIYIYKKPYVGVNEIKYFDFISINHRTNRQCGLRVLKSDLKSKAIEEETIKRLIRAIEEDTQKCDSTSKKSQN